MDQIIPAFGSFGFMLLAFLVALTVIVFVHEYGHYIIGRLSGIRADVFSIGYGPVLWARTDKRGTQWQIAALPVGGYVKFHGDANAASGKADEAVMAGLGEAERRHTLHGAPLWARAATVAAGPVFNFILSIALFAGFAVYQGVPSDPVRVASLPEAIAGEVALAPGDELLSIAGREVPGWESFADWVLELPEETPLDYRVARGGDVVEIQAPHPFPPLVEGVSPQSAALEAGIEVGDLITSVNGTPLATFLQLRDIVGAGNGDALTLTLQRDGAQREVVLTPRRMDLPLADGGFETRWLIGITGGFLFQAETRAPTPLEAVRAGWVQTKFIITSSVSGLYHMVAGNISSCNLRGPIGIAETSGQAASQGLDNFIWFIAVLSTAVGFLNLFPIPVLDGGHLVFHAWEAITGKPPSDAALRILLTVGLVLILALMVFGLSNDLFCP